MANAGETQTGEVGGEHFPVSADDYAEACDSNLGWCRACQAFEGECVEPDAEGYSCPCCNGTNTVYGAEQALLLGLIDIDEGE